MASIVYNRCKADLAQGELDLDTLGDTLNVQLHTSTYTPNADHNTTADLTNEVSGTGYTAGGATLANQAITQDDTNDRAYLDADDVTWSSSTITARYAVVVDVTNSNSLVCLIDFATDQSSSSGNFVLSWSSDGIMRLA